MRPWRGSPKYNSECTEFLEFINLSKIARYMNQRQSGYGTVGEKVH